jgi:PIN domain nuclease of toxin-antitoxin system
MNYVLDACAMIAFLRGEEGAKVVSDTLQNPVNHCFSHAINLCEVYYDFVRAADLPTAKSALRDLRSIGIRTRSDMSRSFWMRVGNVKGTVRKISLADCFAVELSRRLAARLLTSDHHEFDPLVNQGLCEIQFIR